MCELNCSGPEPQSRTRWFGVLLAVYIGSFLGIFAMAIVIRVGLLLFPVPLIAIPLMVYDLLFRAPYKGRFERARAERRLRSQ